MLSIKNWQSLSLKEKQQCLMRPQQTYSIRATVSDIIKEVQNLGDKALFELTQKFDGAALEELKVPDQKIQAAIIDSPALTAISEAIKAISTFHKALLPENTSINTSDGIDVLNVYRPIQRVGLYVPAGNKTPLVSSVLMQAIPARVAGCPIKVLCTPPDSTGEINPHIH